MDLETALCRCASFSGYPESGPRRLFLSHVGLFGGSLPFQGVLGALKLSCVSSCSLVSVCVGEGSSGVGCVYASDVSRF